MVASFLNTGKTAAAETKKAELQAEQKKAAMENEVQRFYLKEGQEKRVTFLDGVLMDDGMLFPVNYKEHQIKLNGNWRNWFPCVQYAEACPLCEEDLDPPLVYLFTVIDHTGYVNKSGEAVKNNKLLFACKRESFKKLQSLGVKRGGLIGLTIDISRTSAKVANTGDMFDVVNKSTLEEIKTAYSLEAGDVVPYDYQAIIEYRTAAELLALGLGTASATTAGAPISMTTPPPNYDNEL